VVVSTETRGRRPLPPPSERERQRLERMYVSQGLTVEEVATRLGTTYRRAQAMLWARGGQAPLASSPRRRCVEAEMGSGPAEPALCAQAW
jgi:hypothetical protein